MSKFKNLVMFMALALVCGLGIACFSFHKDNKKPAGKAEIPECAGLSGQAKIDCEARHSK